MKKNFKFYLLIWAIAIVVFNLVVFLVPAWGTLEKYTPSFWIGYAFTMAAFVGQILCAYKAFAENDAQKQFYKLSLFTASYAGLIATIVLALVCMLVPIIPGWVSAIVCCVVLLFNVIAVAKAQVVTNLVVSSDEKLSQQTAVVYSLRAEAKSLIAIAQSAETKKLAVAVSDAIQYADPMSNEGLLDIENLIKEQFATFAQAVKTNDVEQAKLIFEQLINSVKARNEQCKLLK